MMRDMHGILHLSGRALRRFHVITQKVALLETDRPNQTGPV
jgi:hypothetical protein